jgi:hypothetical protein
VLVLFMKINQFGSCLLVTSTEKLRGGCTFARVICARNVQCKLNLNLKSSVLRLPGPFLVALAKLRKAAVSFVKFVYMDHPGFNRADFSTILHLSIFRNSVEKV